MIHLRNWSKKSQVEDNGAPNKLCQKDSPSLYHRQARPLKELLGQLCFRKEDFYTGRFSASSRNFKPWCCVYAAQYKNPQKTQGAAQSGINQTREQLCGKGPGGAGGQAQSERAACCCSREPTACWAASARASPAETKKLLTHSTQHLSGHT